MNWLARGKVKRVAIMIVDREFLNHQNHGGDAGWITAQRFRGSGGIQRWIQNTNADSS
jgi:hypothetical protein